MEKINEMDFRRIIAELEEVYGDLKDQQVEVYYKYLKCFSEEILIKAFDEIIKSHEYKSFPVIAKIYKMADFFIKQKHFGRKIPTYCAKCESSGMIAVDVPDRQGLAYRCDCKNGDAYRKTLPLYDKEKHSPPFDPLMKKLGIIRYSEVLKDRSAIFPEGATVIFPCKSEGCITEYTVDFKREISAAEIIEAYKVASQGKAGGLCDNCYYLAGKYYFLWT